METQPPAVAQDCSYAITRQRDLKLVRIFPSPKDAEDYIRFDTQKTYQIERVYHRPYVEHPAMILVVFIDREDDPRWSPSELFQHKKMQRARGIKTQPRAIREYAHGTSRKKWEAERLKELESRMVRSGGFLPLEPQRC